MASEEEKFFRLLAEQYGAHWEPLATHLGLSNDRITLIKQDKQKTEEQIFEMLMTWKQSNPPGDVTAQTLATALAKCGRRDLERQILEGTFQPSEDPPPSPCTKTGRSFSIPDVLTDQKLRRLSDHLAGEWRRLATHLGLSSDRVSKIQRDHRQVQEQIFMMLMDWKHRETTKDPLGRLQSALREIGRLDLADKLMFDAI
ncbi:uncharacterized protein LOC119730315 [Patiria miniata]|uniref:Death domain-containing protein n=1 Tax=Patiria miniata TaxID=46514 RepID=A0A914A5S0_PATMI|nr:uncharacterized protein LOC119730315 [Patiria miniata]XP_038059079.1 uncharacterized protein LOC119730315 [Patiria miniata]XP_038059080.1 uncharacterized protein LOC119730315 [Patiria miniata]XP_038059081.1 uncharacterized protein LOC119730315 [Patiria miniata]